MITASPRAGIDPALRPQSSSRPAASSAEVGSSFAGFELVSPRRVVDAPASPHHRAVIEILRGIQGRRLDGVRPEPVGPTSMPKGPTLSNRELDFIVRIMNAIENNDHSETFRYGAVMRYRDGTYRGRPVYQYTLSVGFTELGGNLKRVLERYQAHGGKLSGEFQRYIDAMNGTPMARSTAFEDLLRRAASEDAMKRAQHEIFAERYLAPAIRWGERNGFEEPLSYLVIVDSFLHSGSILNFLRRRFPERPPASGGTERGWIQAYTRARYQWLKNHSNRILRNTAFRPHTWNSEMGQGNWQLTGAVEASDPLRVQRWTVQATSNLPRFP